jgi:hypothetical protein
MEKYANFNIISMFFFVFVQFFVLKNTLENFPKWILQLQFLVKTNKLITRNAFVRPQEELIDHFWRKPFC